MAPSLFPFMALMPLLTSPEANRFYNAALGGLMRRLFGLPGSAAAPMVAGMIAGSPAGCIAARAVAAEEGFTRGELERVALACCGLSPAFFISAVGAGMLGDAALGHVLLRAQLMTQLSMLALGRLFCRDDEPVGEVEPGNVSKPVLSIINVAGYMALFGAIAGALRAPAIQLILDITAGSRFLCGLNIDIQRKLIALSALAGYGGLCVCVQNIGVLKACGVRPVRFMAARCLAGLLAAEFTAIQIKIAFIGFTAFSPEFFNISCILAVLIAIPALIRIGRTIF